MRENAQMIKVAGIEFETYSDYIKKGTYATDSRTGETKMIRGGGYLFNELSIRKAIAAVFSLPTFRK